MPKRNIDGLMALAGLDRPRDPMQKSFDLDEGPAQAPLPNEVVYTHPNPDSSKKNCSNCMFFTETEQCIIHRPEIHVSAEMICSYHIYGKPLRKHIDRGQDFMDPDISGLAIVPGGTACLDCRFYTQRAAGGLCSAMADAVTGEVPALVEALGCCARWSGKVDE